MSMQQGRVKGVYLVRVSDPARDHRGTERTAMVMRNTLDHESHRDRSMWLVSPGVVSISTGREDSQNLSALRQAATAGGQAFGFPCSCCMAEKEYQLVIPPVREKRRTCTQSQVGERITGHGELLGKHHRGSKDNHWKGNNANIDSTWIKLEQSFLGFRVRDPMLPRGVEGEGDANRRQPRPEE